MGIPAALCIVGTLLACSRITAASQDGDLPGLFAPCSATLAPEGPCEQEKDECPFVFNLPPMTVNLPKQLMDLEKIVEELQLLKDNVDELRKLCKDCAVSQTEKVCAQEAEKDADKHGEERIWVSRNPETKKADKQIWESERENNKRVINEETGKDGKTRVTDKQVVAAGKNVRITERKKIDRKQIERDGAVKGALDKSQSRISNASHLQNRTIGKTDQHLWQDKMMDSKKQTEAADEMEDGREKVNPRNDDDINEQLEGHELQDKIKLDEKSTLGKNNDTKRYHITIASSKEDQEDMFKNKEEKTKPSSAQDKGNKDISDGHIWQDKHHKVDHEERLEKMFSNINKSTEEPIDSDRPVWRDKTQVDQNQMETGRYGEGIEERGKTISSDVSDKEINAKKSAPSGHHVWRDETMETGSVERIKMSVDGGDDKGQDHSEEMGRNNGNAKQAEREKPVKKTGKELKGEKPLQKLREGEFENRKVMEGTDLNSAGQDSVINSTSGHEFIDLDQAVTLTSPPRFTTSHLTTDVKQGLRKTAQNNERGSSSNVHSILDAESDMNARDYEESKIERGGEKVEDENDQTEQPTMQSKFSNKWKKEKIDKSNQQKPTKTANSGRLDTTSSTSNSDFKIAKRPPPQSNHNERDTNFEHSNLDEELAKVLKQATKTAPTINELDTATSTPTASSSHLNTDAIQGERKTTYGAPSQSSHNENNTNTEHSSLDSQSSKSTSKVTKVSGVLDEDSSHLTTDVKQGGQKTTFKPPSQRNQKEKDSDTMHTNLDRLPKMSGERSKTATIIGASDTTSSPPTDSKSHFTTDIKQGHRKIGKGPLSQINYNEMDTKTRVKIASQPLRPLDEDTTSSTPTVSRSHFNTDVKPGQGKSTSSQNNQDGTDSDTMHSNLDEQLTRISSNQSKTASISSLNTTGSTPTAPKSHFTTDIKQGHRKIGKEPPPRSNYNKMDTKTRVKIAGQPTRPLSVDPTSSTPTVSRSHFNTDVKPGQGKSTSSQNNQDGTDSDTMHSNLDEQLTRISSNQSKTASISSLNTTGSTPTAPKSHFTTDIKQGHRKIGKEPPPRSNYNKMDTKTRVKIAGQPTRPLSVDPTSSIPTVSRLHFNTDIQPGQGKSTSTQNNQDGTDSDTMHSNLDEQLTRISSNQSKTASISSLNTTGSTPTAPKSHFTTDIKQGHRKIGKEPPPRSNYNKMDTKTRVKIAGQPTRPLVEDATSSTPTVSRSHFTIDIQPGQGKSTPKKLNLPKSGIQQTTGASAKDATSSSPTATNTHFSTDVKQITDYEAPSQSNPDEKQSGTEHSSLDAQLAKATSQPTTSALAEDPTSSDPTTSKSHITTHLKQGHQNTTTETPSQSNYSEEESDNEHSTFDAQSTKTTSELTKSALAEDATSSDPTASKSQITTHLKQRNENTAKEPPSQSNSSEEDSETGHLSFNAKLAKATSQPTTSTLAEDATISPPTASKQGHQKTAKEPQSNYKEKDSETEHLSPDEQPARLTTRSPLAEDTTSSNSAVSDSRFTTDLKQGPRKTPHRLPSTNSNEKDSEQSSLDPQLATVTSQPTTNAFFEDITTSIPASTTILRHHASFKDEITSTTFTSLQISPTTTLPPTADNRLTAKEKISLKTTQNQRPKLSPKQDIGMKPEANQKLKNPKNDRKPDRVPSPDTRAKKDQRQKPVTHPKVTPGKALQGAQIPKSDQSGPSHHLQVKVNETDNRLPLVVPQQTPRPPIQAPTLATSMTGLLIDEHLTSNATSMPDERQPILSEIDRSDKAGGILTNEGSQRPKQFTKKTEHKQNNTSSFMLNQNNQVSSEFNGTTPEQSFGKKVNPKVSKINQKPKSAQVLKVKPEHPKMEAGQKTKVKPKLEQPPKAKIPKNSSKVSPGLKPLTKPFKPKAIPPTKIKPPLKPKESMLNTDMVPTSGPIKLTTERGTEFKTTTLNPETAHDLGADPLRHINTVLEGFTMSSDSRVTSDEGPQTTSPAPSIPLTTEPNKATQGSTSLPSNSDFIEEEKHTKLDKTFPSSPPRVQLRPTHHSVFSSTTPPAAGPKDPAAELTTPSARELRVKINQVAAFFNKSSQHLHGRPLDLGPGEHHEDKQGGGKTELTGNKNPAIKPGKDIKVIRDCSDHVLRGHTESGLYLVTPDPTGGSFHVFCDMEVDGGGWTVLQRRKDGSVSFNRSWAEYQEGFGELNGGEFWLGNNMIHLLTRDRAMELRVELEDFEGVQEYAHYKLFKVASERLRYRLTVGGYSGTAGDALRFNTKYDHSNRAFTTPDRDNDRYPSGNCGAYYSSGWWFDACMAANLNGRYYKGRYKGVRDGIYWGTWHNISSEYYPTNERQSFKTVRMMIRPKAFKQ